MRAASILLLCILGAALLSSVNCSNANSPSECCFTWYPRRINKRQVVSYYLTGDRCTKIGVIFVTAKARHICVNPNLSWVEGIMKNLDESSF
ncbi:C-C motif chemokine 36.1 [Sphaeramia orbicularis]|uniref:C-C motif chemokine n=1 Tax=Sphaeramia orbicularis TaxID=375764 RepID=A0A673B915_9TELE|nr:C-C motif chemokine 3-like [Sphaeramia orbicularis]